MKKLLSLVAIAGLFSLVACGPSKEEQEKAEKMRQDSVAKVQADSMAAVQAAAQAKASADSMAAAQSKMQADSMEAAAKMATKGAKKEKKAAKKMK